MYSALWELAIKVIELLVAGSAGISNSRQGIELCSFVSLHGASNGKVTSLILWGDDWSLSAVLGVLKVPASDSETHDIYGSTSKSVHRTERQERVISDDGTLKGPPWVLVRLQSTI